jgi:serine/threonine-protein kinase HipA
MLFNLRAGNQDDHGKNHAFLYDEEFRTWHLAPAYDLTHSPGLDRGLTIAGQVVPQWSRLREWLADAGLRPAEIKQAGEAVDDAIAAWPKLARKHSVTAAQITEITATHKRIAAQFGRAIAPTATRAKSKKVTRQKRKQE